jgi:hypothetical protein
MTLVFSRPGHQNNLAMPMIKIALYIRTNCPKLPFLVVPCGTPERNKICCETPKKILAYNDKNN